jgi:AmiR/NasT family two-component response regulator
MRAPAGDGGTHMRILIAEDEAIIRLDLKEMLTELGHEVIAEAADGATAVKLARRKPPDLAILDIKMPVMDGLKAAKVMTDEHLCPVLILTAFSQKGYVEEAVNAGAIGYLVKPFERKDLEPAIQVAIARYAELRKASGEAENLKARLEDRKFVEKVKGLLMQRGMTEPEAFRSIQKRAMDQGISLRSAAEGILKEWAARG